MTSKKYTYKPDDIDMLLTNGDIYIRAIPGEVWKLCCFVHRSPHSVPRVYHLVECESERITNGQKPRIYSSLKLVDVFAWLLLHDRGAKYDEHNPVPEESNVVKLDFQRKR